MIFQQRRLQRRAREAHLQVIVRQTVLRQHVTEFGQRLHHKLGTVGLLATGFSAGWLFDRIRPHWQGVYSAGGLGILLLRTLPLLETLSRLTGRAGRPPA